MPKKGRKTCKHLQYCQFSRSTLSSDSDSFSYPLGLTPVKSQKNLTSQAKRDYLARLYEKKKLKDKSLSKKLQTPFDRKLNRSCWPIQLSKISKIKKKPKEKKKGKPNYKSLRKKKSSKLMFFRNLRKARPRVSLSESR